MGIYGDLLKKIEMEPTKKPNIELPEGFELKWNDITYRWQMVPVKGYSSTYLEKDHFVPKKGTSSEDGYTKEKGKNSNLHKAKSNKNDEFYTRLADIAEELSHYKAFFKDKVVYCPCDKGYNVGRSNFFNFFSSVYEEWGLKGLIATQYNPNEGEHGIVWRYNGDINGNEIVDENEISTDFLYGNGSFDSKECKEIMEECDIVVTNPPFSLFRPFVGQIMNMGKKFLIIGSQNAITYKDIFGYIKDNKMWLGYHNNVTYIFESPNGNELKSNREYVSARGLDPDKYIKVPAICWFTNLPHTKRTEELYLGGTYTENSSNYPHYDGFDGIDIGRELKDGSWEGRIELIPNNYYGVMGVPITFLGKYNPNQFEIVGSPDADILPEGWNGASESFVNLYYEQGNTGIYHIGNRLARFINKKGKAVVTYKRILIKRKTE